MYRKKDVTRSKENEHDDGISWKESNSAKVKVDFYLKDETSKSIGTFAFYCVLVFLISSNLEYIRKPGSLYNDLVSSSLILSGFLVNILPATIFNYICVAIQAKILDRYGSNSSLKWIEGAFLSTFLTISMVFFIKPAPGGALNFFILLEQPRFLLKFWSLFIETQYHGEVVPTVKEAYIFLFSPTLIYQKKFKKRARIRWNNIFMLTVDISVGLCASSLLINDYIKPARDRLLNPSNWTGISFSNDLFVYFAATHSFPIISYLLIYFPINALTGELLRLEEMPIYGDFWNANSLNDMIKRLNYIVHSSIQRYIYQPLQKILPSNVVSILVLLISAFSHDIQLYYSYGGLTLFCTLLVFVVVLLNLIGLHVDRSMPKALLCIIYSYCVLIGCNGWTTVEIMKNLAGQT